MKFAAGVLAFLTAVASAKKLDLSGDMPADSEMAKSLLKRATVVEPSRHLEQQRENSFIYKYSIKYLSCSSLVQVAGEGGGGGQNEGILYTQHLVRFALCPEDSCGSCSGGGEYVVNMRDFVDAYTEAKLTEQEYTCEMIRENCYCNNNQYDDQYCENMCYTEQGHEECIQYEGEEEFEAQRYLECAEMENQNGNNNQNANYYYGADANGFYGNYYIGPYCSPSDGKSILLGVFYDQGCVNRAESSVYADRNYGKELPFSKQSMVTINECISCKQVDQNQNQNQNQNNGNYYYEENYEVNEICTQSYEQAARCESHMDIPYPDTTGCTYIHNILPRLEAASRAVSGRGGAGRAGAALAWVFAATTILFGAYAYFLYRKIKRGQVNLSAQDGAIA